MPNIFEYTDFRVYLKDCYEEKKRKNPAFSYQVFTRIIGFTNRGFLFNVIKGKRKLSMLHCYKISKGLKHSPKEAEYFENIVALTLARNDDERNHFLGRIQQTKKEADGIDHQTQSATGKLEEDWHTVKPRFLFNYSEAERNSAAGNFQKTPFTTSVTLWNSECANQVICVEERQFQKRVIGLEDFDLNAGRIYQYQLILFPLTTTQTTR
jgi:hypothetical protein